MERSAPAPRSPLVASLAAVVVLVGFVLGVSLLTNRMQPRWDGAYYLDMAQHGLRDNPRALAPFAYRPAVPLFAGWLARSLEAEPLDVFEGLAHLAAILLLVGAFYFARRLGTGPFGGLAVALGLGVHFVIVKWTLLTTTMVDVYGLLVSLGAFWLLLERRFWACLAVSTAGLLFKEFLLVPLLAQAAALVLERPRKPLAPVVAGLLATLAALLLGFVLPRALIAVHGSWQDVDPAHDPAFLQKAWALVASPQRHLNLAYSAAAFWMPTLLLLDRRRLNACRDALRPSRVVLVPYAAALYLLALFGGTNLFVFVTYSLGLQALVLAVLLRPGGVPAAEALAALAVAAVFNRLWATVPLPEADVLAHVSFYGGWSGHVGRHGLLRMAELAGGLAGFHALRLVARRLAGAPAPPSGPPSPDPTS